LNVSKETTLSKRKNTPQDLPSETKLEIFKMFFWSVYHDFAIEQKFSSDAGLPDGIFLSQKSQFG
jgi:hypothetical protein